MDDPIAEVTDVVLRLTEGSPKVQEQTINTYFTPNASFTHPFCRTGSFEGSRLLIHGIFRCYKIMSPRIEAKVNGIAYDETNMVLYVNISQVFAIWFIPFHRSPVTLTTQLQLTHKPAPTRPSTKQYYIQSQNDLYPVDQFVRFFAPWGIGDAVVYLWHFWAMLFCVLLSLVFSPFTRLEERWAEGKVTGAEKVIMRGVNKIEERRMQGFDGVRSVASQAADGIHEVANGVRQDLGDSPAKSWTGFGAESTTSDEHGSKDQKQFGSTQVVT